jgi:hypothetical protein
MKFVFNFDLKLYTRDTFVISTKRCEKPSDNTSTVDRDACYYSSHSIISALIISFRLNHCRQRAEELRSKMFGQHPGYFKADTDNYRKYL